MVCILQSKKIFLPQLFQYSIIQNQYFYSPLISHLHKLIHRMDYRCVHFECFLKHHPIQQHYALWTQVDGLF